VRFFSKRSIQSARVSTWSKVTSVSTSTASRSPWISVALIGDHIDSSPGPCGGAPAIGLIGAI
jgi:hypothetical protein